MEKQDIQLYDIPRILFGEVPAAFYLEAVFRMVVIYLVLMLSMRFMGKRLASQIGRNEMAAMVSLAAAIGVPLQDPTRGILPIVIIAFVVMFLHNLTGRKAAANQQFERFSQGDMALLIADGVLDLENLKKSRLARGRLFAQLRFTKVTHRHGGKALSRSKWYLQPETQYQFQLRTAGHPCLGYRFFK